MEIMSEQEVGRYLDDLLVQLEVSRGGNEVLKERFVRVANFYWNEYDLRGYQEKANRILTKNG